jgi:excinuclease ABC subunit C
MIDEDFFPEHESHYGLDPEHLKRVLPEGPGVYLFKDRSGRVIYVGKAKSLKKRVLSYFKASSELPPKTAWMMKRAGGLDPILTASEKEALILESNLIKKFLPRYNVVLRDDKQYPCIRLDVAETYPRLAIVRRIKKDGAVYFGPFSSAQAVRKTLKLIERVFPIRKCKGRGLPKNARPCINHEMGRCLGPCTEEVAHSSYGEVVHQIRLFLEGRNRELLDRLRERMQEAAEQLDFERAARIRDQIRSVEKTVERQHVVSPRMEDQDVIGLAGNDDFTQIVILFVRKGYLVGTRDYRLKGQGDSPSEVMEAFLKQFYSREPFIPKKILISEPIEELNAITEWLSDTSGKKVSIHRPVRGEKLRLVRMAVQNAQNLMAGRVERDKDDLMKRVRDLLKLKRVPRHIEGLDISNLHGEMAVGTVVSFVDGTPHPSGYRNYRIKAVEGIDDYGMMVELVSRRLSRPPPPDLFLVDGGKGHLAAVKRAIDQQPGGQPPEVVSIAKADESRQEKYDKIYISGRMNPISLGQDHPVLLLMMRIRDEAHRRAISYHRNLRKKRFTLSALERIPGVGERKKKILLRFYKSVDAIAEADREELARVPGISPSLADQIHRFFKMQTAPEEERGDRD